MPLRIEETEQESLEGIGEISQQTTGVSGVSIAVTLVGAALGGLVGYKYPKTATTIYGIAVGGALGFFIASLGKSI